MATKKQSTKKLSFIKTTPLKMLIAVVVVAAISSLGIYTLTKSDAARGGTKGKPGGTTQFVTTPYGISAVGGTYGYLGVPSTFTVTDRLTGAPLASLDGVETLYLTGGCLQNGVMVGEIATIAFSVTTSVANYSQVWRGGAADCWLKLRVIRNYEFVTAASTTYQVAP